MRKIILDAEYHKGPTIMIFTEGTILKPKSRLLIYQHTAYIPIGNAVHIISAWQQQGANIIYCTSRRNRKADDMAELIRRYGFTGAFLISREQKERYKDIVETIQPDILIEDDCKSIGGAWQMCITKVDPVIKDKIISVVVPEFQGIDQLPTDHRQLMRRS